eukprot:TRINITY_DN2905_c0_g1_i1.p1 TRINITY_DN2905_c0_g1~~TRINITY_DN2905_c0_g1_i1.p1  ORF type:complete len:191 (-),score=52.08 TRINITY_DN2905_c0_g1_i1:53-625(-)
MFLKKMSKSLGHLKEKTKKIKKIGKKVLYWDYLDITSWLKVIDLQDYVHSFIANSIRGDILLDLKESHLKEMGIHSMGTIKRILKSIKQLYPSYFKELKQKEKDLKIPINMSASSKQLEEWNVFDVLKWLDKIGMSEYNSIFIKEMVDGKVLFSLNKNDLKDLGITAIGHQKIILTNIEKMNEKEKNIMI